MRTQHQIANELHDLAQECPLTLDDVLAALHEQSQLTRAQVVTELEAWAKRWPMNKNVVLGCAQAIHLAREDQR